MPIRVITIKEHHYSKTRKVGDAYDLPGESAWQLAKAMGWARKDETVPAPPEPVRTAELPTAKVVAAKKTIRKVGTYLTRDMTSERMNDSHHAPTPPLTPAAPLTPAQAREALGRPDDTDTAPPASE